MVEIGINPILKPDDWQNRLPRLIRGLGFTQRWGMGGIQRQTFEEEPQVIVAAKTGEKPVVSGRPFRFNDMSPELEDGFFGAIDAGGATPPQLNTTSHSFTEVPIRGRLLFLHVDSQGKFSLNYFQVRSNEDSTHAATVVKGEIMSWYAFRNQQIDEPPEWERAIFRNMPAPPALFLEHEMPGFSSANLPTVPDGVLCIGDTVIPSEFWETRRRLENGEEEKILAGIPESHRFYSKKFKSAA